MGDLARAAKPAMESLVELLLRHGALLVFVVTLLARAGAPFPAGPLLVVAGGLAALGQLPLTLTVLLSLLANLLGDAVWYLGGRQFGYRVMRLLCKVSLSPDTCVRQSEGLFGRWGGVSLVAAKFVPGVSVIAAPMAGALRMPWRSFIAWDLAAGVVWTGLYMGLGALFRTEISRVLDVLAAAGVKALVALLVLVAGAVAWRWVKRHRLMQRLDVPRVSVVELAEAIGRNQAPVILDVRGQVAREAAPALPGALAVELRDLAQLPSQLLPDAELVVYCNCPNDESAVVAASRLKGMGFGRVSVLAGGHDAWVQATGHGGHGGHGAHGVMRPPAPPPPPPAPRSAAAGTAAGTAPGRSP
jgi:membrane protein DedA with SNARE-associated domain/rhodanese-related sulfurtransferase